MTSTISTTQDIRRRYDTMPYGNLAHTFSAPENITMLAGLFGAPGADLAAARVLELGCAAGFNLMPFALRNPGAQCVGVDLSGVQIAAGIEAAAKIGVANLTLIEADLLEIEPEKLGQFDYIIAHGLYSWVPPSVQQAIFAIIRRCLAPEGVAYVSYNVYPGWKSKEVLRDAMLLHAGNETDVGKQVASARAMVEFMLKIQSGQPKHPLAPFKEHLENARGCTLEYLAHEYLATCNLPCYFSEFVERAGAHGLSFLSEAELSMMIPSNYGEDGEAWLRDAAGEDPIKLGQYTDFLVNRTFRQSLLVHADRASVISRKPDRAAMATLNFAARVRCVGEDVRLDGSVQRFESPLNQHMGAELSAHKLVLMRLTEAFPGTLTREELIDSVFTAQAGAKDAVPRNELASVIDELIEYILLRGMGRAWQTEVAAGTSDARVPMSDPVVRKLASLLPDGKGAVVNVWHDTTQVTALERELIQKLDGSMDRAALESFIGGLVASGRIGLRAAPGGDVKTTAQTATAAVLNRMATKGFLAR